MDHFFDQAARILASPMPRRQALRQLGGLIAGGVLASLGAGPARAQTAAGSSSPPCKGNDVQCPGITRPFCRTQKQICCGDGACNPGDQCCPGLNKPFCKTQKQTCCGNVACKSGDKCCPGNGVPFCVTQKQSCCGSKACKSGEVCCNGTMTCCKQCNQQGQCTGSPS